MADDIDRLLDELGLGKYAQVFAENEVDVDAALHLSDDDLKDMGLPLGPRRKFAAAIGDIRTEERPRQSAAASKTASADPPGERRQVTALFADISGFTSLSSGLDAEETHALLNDFFAVVDAAVAGFGGRVDKHIGDAVMAVFGAPVAHTDDPERALRAALEIHQEVREVEPPLKVHIGVASGQVVASTTGSSTHTEYTVTGDSVNLAARLTDLADAGETLVSSSVQRALGARFNGTNLGEKIIAGFPEPVTIWRLTELVGGPSADNQAFVGRSRELGQFGAALDHCLVAGTGQTVIVRGEAGIGKTRLIEEFEAQAVAMDYEVHTGLVLDFGTAKGQDAVRALVRSLLVIPPGSGKAVRSNAAETALRNNWLPKSRCAHLNDLLDLPQPPELAGVYEAMDNETRNRGKQEALGDLLRAKSGLAPQLLRVEDAHWADPIILAHLAHLAKVVHGLPVLLVVTTRITGDQLDHHWRAGIDGASLVTIDLSPLDASEAMGLARHFNDLDEDIIAACVERSGGNPLFLEQLLRNADEFRAGDIPGSVQGIIQARLDALTPDDREVIQAASILGQRFSGAEVEHLCEGNVFDPSNLLRSVLIRPAGEDYHFAHALIREAVYASLLRARRIGLHRRAATWFEDSDLILRAEHLDKAGESGAAPAYLDAAEEEAGKQRNERALRLVERGLELDKTSETNFDLTCLLGDLLRDLGQVDRSIAAFDRSLAIAGEDEQICRGHIGMAEGLRIRGRYTDGLESISAAEAVISSKIPARTRSHLCHLKGNLYFPLGQIDACLNEHERALQLGQESGSAEAQARAFGGMADANYLRGSMLSAKRLFERCITLAKEANLPSIAAGNLSMLACAQTYALEFKESQASFGEALETSRTIGNYRAEILARGAVAYSLVQLGLFEDALVSSRAAYDMACEFGVPAFAASSLRHQSWVHLEEGDIDQAAEMAERAWEFSVENNLEKFVGPMCLGIIARSSNSEGRRDWAIEEGVRILAEGTASHNHLFFHRDIMEVGLQRNDKSLLEKACDALAEFTQAEPLPWSDFHIARANALYDFYVFNDRGAAIEILRALKLQIEQVGFKTALPRIDEALSEVD